MTKAAKSKVVEESKSLGDRASEFLNISAKENIDMFEEKMTSHWTQQIRKAKSKLNSLKEDFDNEMRDHQYRLDELRKECSNSFLRININRVSSVIDRQNYVESYETQINDAFNLYRNYERAVDMFVNSYEIEAKTLNSRISFWEECLKFGKE
jgi:hypothetical protein